MHTQLCIALLTAKQMTFSQAPCLKKEAHIHVVSLLSYPCYRRLYSY